MVIKTGSDQLDFLMTVTLSGCRMSDRYWRTRPPGPDPGGSDPGGYSGRFGGGSNPGEGLWQGHRQLGLLIPSEGGRSSSGAVSGSFWAPGSSGRRLPEAAASREQPSSTFSRGGVPERESARAYYDLGRGGAGQPSSPPHPTMGEARRRSFGDRVRRPGRIHILTSWGRQWNLLLGTSYRRWVRVASRGLPGLRDPAPCALARVRCTGIRSLRVGDSYGGPLSR